jgi:hypothetical protein
MIPTGILEDLRKSNEHNGCFTLVKLVELEGDVLALETWRYKEIFPFLHSCWIHGFKTREEILRATKAVLKKVTK